MQTTEEIKTQGATDQPPKPAAPAMTANKIIKLMLIRIGDEKREMIEQHLTILNQKMIELHSKNEPEANQEIMGVFESVLTNLSHKTMIYASLVGLLAAKQSQFAKELVDYILTTSLQKHFIHNQDAFASRNIFRFVGCLVDLNVISSTSAKDFITSVFQSGVQESLSSHCVLTLLTTQSAGAKIGNTFDSVLKTKIESLTRSPKSCLEVLWEAYSANPGQTFDHSQSYLNISAGTIKELQTGLATNSPISKLPACAKVAEQIATFQNQQDNFVIAKKYVPQAGPTGYDTTRLIQFQACSDLIWAFSESHKNAAQNLLKMHVGESQKENFNETIADVLLSYVVSLNPFDDQISQKPMIYFAQVANIVSQELEVADQGAKFRKTQINSKIIDFLSSNLDFKYVPNLIMFQVFLNSQHEKDLVNNEFLQELETKLKAKSETFFQKVIHYYLSYCCQLGYHKPILENLPEEFHDFMPNIDNLKPKLEYVVNKKILDEMSEDGDQKLEGVQAEVQSEVEHIMGVLAQKGDPTELLKELFEDKTKIKSEGLRLKKIFLEVVFTKFGVHSLEHVSRGIQKVRTTVGTMFKDQQDAQNMVLDSIFKQFGMDQMSAQNYDKENLFMIQFKLINLVERLNQIGVLNASFAIEWCLDQLEKFEGDIQVEFCQFQLILTLLKNSETQCNHLIARFRQIITRPSEVRIETPFERYQRENNIEPADGETREERKEKTPEEIIEEKAKITADYEEKFKQAQQTHKATLEKVKGQIKNKEKFQKLSYYIDLL